jgi:N utilization substance protein B
MSNRHIGRTLALQTLFELDMCDNLSLPKEAMEAIVVRDRDELADNFADTDFVVALVADVQSRRITLDDIITRAAPDWPLDKINTVDRNILRLGLCELLFGERTQVPPKVAIDEAIELAKTFGGDTSGKFVNGVLGAIYKEMGEPEKAQTSKKPTGPHPKENLAGAVVYSIHDGITRVALVHDVFGYWTLTKGKVEGEGEIEALAVKKIKTEIGIDTEIIASLGENEYIANKPEVGKVIKHVHYFLAKAQFNPLTLEKKGGLDDVRWFTLDELRDLRTYDDIMPLIEKGLSHIAPHKD